MQDLCDKLLRCECGNGRGKQRRCQSGETGETLQELHGGQEGDCELEGAHTGEQCLQF